jgi:UDP-N-acetylglucosamine--N-acetylmuramyl-(pentapeptide) pyrophosphoryl-undecaprenol N-acetylglucosamine transferase
MTTIIIMAGGTGGHVFPALAVARAMRDQGVRIVWLGTREGIEARIVPAAGFALETIAIRGLRGGGWVRWLLLPMRLNVAMFQAWQILRRIKPDAVLAMGGFASGPGSLMASALRIPLLIHEQNAIAGLTNHWLAKIADVVMAGFPTAFGTRHGVRVVGNPVRQEILALSSPEKRLAVREGRMRLLVVGGSQGAQVFNQVVPEAVRALPEEGRPQLWHQTGKSDEAAVLATYRVFQPEAKVVAFIDDMAAAYDWADVVVCRAGAMTIAELSAAGVAAILVPFPHATDDHQTANARFLETRDAAVLLPQPDFNAVRLAELLASLGANRPLLQRLAVNARACATIDATETVTRLCLEATHA